MQMTVKTLLRLLQDKDPNVEVHLAVEGFESAPLLAKVEASEGIVLLRLSAASEVAQVLGECDIIR
jgi:hypothetical protein